MSANWLRLPRDPQVVQGSVRQALRLLLIALGQLSVAGWVTLWGWRAVSADAKLDADDRSRGASESASLVAGVQTNVHSLRVAYVGPTPQQGAGGVVGSAWLIIERLARSGLKLDFYVTVTDNEEQIDALTKSPDARIIPVGSAWRFDRWYSRRDLTKMVTGLGSQAFGRRRLVGLIAEQHALVPYDALYQFSTIEMFGRQKDRRRLPPIVLHPEVHAAGELRWMHFEKDLSRRCEGRVRPKIVMGWFLLRSRRQRRDISRAATVLAISEAFERNLIEDYGVQPERVHLVPNPIDLISFRPKPRTEGRPTACLQLVMVGRISVRKGVEQIVELSHRLGDLAGSVQLAVYGSNSQWSDYRALLRDLAPEVASYRGHISQADLQRELPTWDLLLQPAKYEPFGITVGEALACGVPVIVTTEVGSGESVSSECCTRVPVGDLDALEQAVRDMIFRLQSPEASAIRLAARREAERLWSATRVASLVESALAEVPASVWSRAPSGAKGTGL
jgi:glycosyltransferase involved in cell wall biosynthesis